MRYSKRFNRQADRPNDRIVSARHVCLSTAILLLPLSISGCGPGVRSASHPNTWGACREVNEVLALCSRGELAMAGRVTMDVNQYRVRGAFSLYISEKGDVTLEYTSSGVMGGGRQDAVFAFVSDTLRVLDREHGEYYEGDEVVELVAGSTGKRVDVAELVRRITARPLDCEGLEYRAVGPSAGEGRRWGRPFKLHLDTRLERLLEARWHLPSLDEEVKISYRWDGADHLAELTIEIPVKRWRIRLQTDS